MRFRAYAIFLVPYAAARSPWPASFLIHRRQSNRVIEPLLEEAPSDPLSPFFFLSFFPLLPPTPVCVPPSPIPSFFSHAPDAPFRSTRKRMKLELKSIETFLNDDFFLEEKWKILFNPFSMWELGIIYRARLSHIVDQRVKWFYTLSNQRNKAIDKSILRSWIFAIRAESVNNCSLIIFILKKLHRWTNVIFLFTKFQKIVRYCY